jgi:hypothetical protein
MTFDWFESGAAVLEVSFATAALLKIRLMPTTMHDCIQRLNITSPP